MVIVSCLYDFISSHGVPVTDPGIKVVVGAHRRTIRESSQQINWVKRIWEYPQYDSDKTNNDLALLKLRNEIRYTDEISPVCLSNVPSTAGQRCVTTGWGNTQSMSFLDKRLLDIYKRNFL